MKIKIKHDRVKLSTSDTKLALLVLNELYQKEGGKKEEGDYEYKKESIGLLPDKADERVYISPEKDRKNKFVKRAPRASWTVAEDLAAIELIYEPTIKAVRNKMLLKRHTPQAIRSRISKMRMTLREFKGDIESMTKDLLKGRDLSVVDQREMTLRAERRPEEKPEGKKEEKTARAPKAKKKSRKIIQNAWTEEELNILKNNITLPPLKLVTLLPGRTKSAISFQKKYRARKMGLKLESNVNTWPEMLKEKVVELSDAGYTAIAISKMPEFAGRTPSQINATVYRLKNKKK